jgi:endo-1,4-beta-xylanase
MTRSRSTALAIVTIVAALAAVAVAAQGRTEPALKGLVPPGMLIGAAVNQEQSDGKDTTSVAIVTHHFNTITPENMLKWERVHPEPGRYDFEPVDRLVAFGERHGLKVVGHTLVWHQQTPKWVFTKDDGSRADRAALAARMKEHIDAVAGRYRGRIHGWDVVNEALEEDGTLRKSPWREILGDDYIALAFEYARAADPKTELYYNDYNLWKPEKLEGALRIARDLRARGLRIDGIGEQGHYVMDGPSVAEVESMVQKIAAAGFKVHITELDVDVLPRDEEVWGADLAKQAKIREVTDLYVKGLPEAQQRQLAQRYAELFAVFARHHESIARVTFWGVTDRHTWLHNFPVRGRTNHPLLWDRDGRPKPAFDAVVEVLKARRN